MVERNGKQGTTANSTRSPVLPGFNKLLRGIWNLFSISGRNVDFAKTHPSSAQNGLLKKDVVRRTSVGSSVLGCAHVSAGWLVSALGYSLI